MTIRIVGWNIRAGGGKRQLQIAEQIRQWDADLVVLSEFRATPPSQALALQLKQQGYYHQRWSDKELRRVIARQNQVFVASRLPLRRLHLEVAPQESGRWIYLAVGGRKPFRLGGMHIPNQVTGRKPEFHAGVVKVAEHNIAGPLIMVGDTNSGRIGIDEENPVFNVATDRWFAALEQAGCVDLFRHHHPEKQEYTWYSPNGDNGFRLDQIFTSTHLAQRTQRVWHDWGDVAPQLSDHAAVIADIEL